MVLLLLELYREHESLFTKVKQKKNCVDESSRWNTKERVWTNDVGGMREKILEFEGNL